MSKNLMLSFLTKAYNKTEDEINALILDGDEIKENALQSLIDLDALKVKKFKDEQTKMFDNGYKKAQKEVLTDYENKLINTLGIESESKGDELIETIKTKFEEKSVSKSKLNDDDVKKHPVFIDYEKKWKKEKEEAVKQKENEFIEFKTNIERGNKINTVKNKAVDIFTSLKPILPADSAKAENLKKLFLKEFDNFDYELSENDIIILNEGKRLENTNGYPVSFNDFVKSKAESIFDFQMQDPKGGTGNEPNKTQAPKQSGGVNMTPKSEAEFGESLLKLGNDNEKIKELQVNYQSYLQKK